MDIATDDRGLPSDRMPIDRMLLDALGREIGRAERILLAVLAGVTSVLAGVIARGWTVDALGPLAAVVLAAGVLGSLAGVARIATVAWVPVSPAEMDGQDRAHVVAHLASVLDGRRRAVDLGGRMVLAGLATVVAATVLGGAGA